MIFILKIKKIIKDIFGIKTEISNVQMLNDNDIDKLYKKINFDIVNEGLRQAEKCLNDALDTKKQLEQKSFILINGYMLVSIAIFSALGFFVSKNNINCIFISFLISGIFFVIGTVFIIFSLRCADYGVIGRNPDTWLQENTIDGDEHDYALIMTYILHDYQENISISNNTNDNKAHLLNFGIWSGFLGILPIAINLIIITMTIIINGYLF